MGLTVVIATPCSGASDLCTLVSESFPVVAVRALDEQRCAALAAAVTGLGRLTLANRALTNHLRQSGILGENEPDGRKGAALIASFEGDVANFAALLDVWPEIRVVLVYRSCLDSVAALLEEAYFEHATPEAGEGVRVVAQNRVHTFASQWVARASAMQRLEQRRPGKCLRILQEDLLTEPQAVVAEVANWVGNASPKNRILFSGDAEGTLARARRTVGSGLTLPVERIGPRVREKASEISAHLGYPELGNEPSLLIESANTAAMNRNGRTVNIPSLSRRQRRGLSQALRVRRECSHASNKALMVMRELERTTERWRQTASEDAQLLIYLLDHPMTAQLEAPIVEIGDRKLNKLFLFTDSRTLESLIVDELQLPSAARRGRLRLVGSDERLQAVPLDDKSLKLIDNHMRGLLSLGGTAVPTVDN